jgi:hypothetical protein
MPSQCLLIVTSVIGLTTLAGCSESQPTTCETAADCNDANDCTADLCDPTTVTCSNLPAVDGTTCDFRGASGVCLSGVCQEDRCAGVDCDDQNDCTVDTCMAEDGSCSHESRDDGEACDFDGFPGTCQAGACQDAGLCEGVDCNDDNECTDDVCDSRNGFCSNVPAADGTPCGNDIAVCINGRCGSTACTRRENDAIYEVLNYVDRNGILHLGTDAARTISFDCVFGSSSSEPFVGGCSGEAAETLACSVGAGCPPDVIQRLEDCINLCTAEVIATAVGGTFLTEDCSKCYGPSAACNTTECAGASCGSVPTSSTCEACRCGQGCESEFVLCSGLLDDRCN